MDKPTIWDNLREFIAGLAFAVFLWASRMTEEQFLAEHERQAMDKVNEMLADPAHWKIDPEDWKPVTGQAESDENLDRG